MTQAFSLTADRTAPAKGMYAYLENIHHPHNVILTGNDVVAGDFVVLDSTSTNTVAPVVKKAGVTEVPYGVVVYDMRVATNKAGDKLAIAQSGESIFLVANSAITVGAKLQFTADGYVDDTTTSTNAYIGYAETKAGAKGDIVQVKLDFNLGVA